MVFGPEFGTRFSITVDTEEEFVWGAGFSRTGHGLASVPALADGQRYFASAGVKPLYYVDAPVLGCDEAAAIFSGLVADNSADFGVHLHPWVTPPFVETVTVTNSYAGNLPESVERSKIRANCDLMESNIGLRPIAYRAGRYGIGPNTLNILAQEGFRFDSSVRSLFDYRDDGGPDFRNETLHPHRVGPMGTIVELPLTTLFTGHGNRFGRSLYRRLDATPTVRGLLARAGLIERIPLTPEGVPADKACDAIDIALDIGLPLLTMSFHSPSLAPGHTPYVRDAADLAAFYHWFDVVLDHCARRGVSNASLADIANAADQSTSAISASAMLA